MKSLLKLRSELNEGTLASSDFYISPETGRKVRSRRISTGYKKAPDPIKDQKAINQEFYKKLDAIDYEAKKVKQEEFIDESANDDQEPPMMLVLKRKSIRMFTSGIKVALYYSKTLNKHFSVPFGSKEDSSIQAESFSIEDLKELDNIVHFDESVSEINEQQANQIINVYEDLNEENKENLLNMVFESKDSFEKLKRFIADYR